MTSARCDERPKSFAFPKDGRRGFEWVGVQVLAASYKTGNLTLSGYIPLAPKG